MDVGFGGIRDSSNFRRKGIKHFKKKTKNDPHDVNSGQSYTTEYQAHSIVYQSLILGKEQCNTSWCSITASFPSGLIWLKIKIDEDHNQNLQMCSSL